MNSFQTYLETYFRLIPSEDWIGDLESSLVKTKDLLSSVSEEQSLFAYADGKWSIREVVQHLIDAERIFSYRALRFARRDFTPLSGWDEVLYGDNAEASKRKLSTLLDEFSLVRSSSKLLFESFDWETLEQKGSANGNLISVEEIGKLMVGHHFHHLGILKDRYLTKL